VPSRAEPRIGARAAAALLLAFACVQPGAAAAAEAPRPALDASTVEAAASAVRADPDLPGVHKRHTWRFKESDAKRDDGSYKPPPWLIAFARWIAEGGRGLVWLLGAAAVVALVVTARRWLRIRGNTSPSGGARLPSHVRELDIRPESLPDDIGAAVRELWLAGERRAALSLLYRGALSRLVHSYDVAIGDASTEGDCVRLARAALAPAAGEFVASLVHAWQLAVYGDRPLPSARVLGLCDDFERQLPALTRGGAKPFANA
jgi:hypothetical protein